jgi:RNA polymerase sigma-70 factor (ECF subfamily)
LFARFVARGDVHALGEVFDATAPELLRIAAHLVGSREQARDLVQSAFLIAIERRADFAAERRVLPWLCGIIANLARNERRRCQRELAAVPRWDVEDPEAAAEAAEFRAAFAQAKAALPEVYRPVLELHLEHGLNAAEIAGALDRPAGTVRTQIVRGLEVLRRRLPRGFVAGLSLVPVNVAALGPARAFVLQRAAELAPATGGAAVAGGVALTVMGGIVNKKLAVFGVIGLALASLGLWVAELEHGRTANPPELPAVLVKASETGGAPARAPTAMPAPPERQQVDESSRPVPASGSLEVIARWNHDDTPARSQAIDVIYADETLGELHPHRVVTDGTGHAMFESLRPGAISVESSTGVHQSAEVTPGSQSTVTLALEGIPVNGQVVDHRGDPVADADVWISSRVRYAPVRNGSEPGFGQYGQCTLRSDAEGRFETRMAQCQCIAAFKAGHGPSHTVYPVRGIGRSPERPVSVVVRLPAECGALAVSARGRNSTPVGNALVLAGPEVPHSTGEMDEWMPPALRASTDQTGLAVLSPLPTGRIPIVVRATGYGPWVGEIEIPAGGTAQLEVSLSEGAVVTGVVFDGVGAPLANALLRHGPEWPEVSLRDSVATTDARGNYQLENLPAGELELVAFHEQWGSVSHKLTVAAGDAQRWDPRMPPRAVITGLVLDVEGQPAPGTSVMAYATVGHANTRTDAAGRFVLSPLCPGQAYQVRAEVKLRGGGIAVAQRSGVPAGAEIELRPSPDQVPTARLRGRVLQTDGTPATGYVLGVETLDGSPGTVIAIGADGTFELGPWDPSRLRLGVQRAGSNRAFADFGVHEMRAGTTADVGNLVLPVPGAVRIRIAGAEKGAATLFRDAVFVDLRDVKEDGIAWDDLPPGNYAVSVTRTGTAPLCGLAEFEVQSGRTTDLAVVLSGASRRELRLELPNGCPAGALILRATDSTGRNMLLEWFFVEGASMRIVLPDSARELYIAREDGWHGRASVTAGGTEPIPMRLMREK